MVFSTWSLSEGVDHAALYEEEEEDQYATEDLENKLSFHMVYKEGCCKDSLAGDELVIAVGNAANSFLEIYLDLSPSNCIGQFCPVVKENKELSRTSKQRTCYIYKIESIVLCLLKYHVEDKDSYAWIKSLHNTVEVKRTSMLCSFSKSMFNGNQEAKNGDTDILRFLKSSTSKKETNVTILEDGNIIRNLPAAVMTHCSAFLQPCMLYVAFTESHYVDAFTLKCFQPVLNDVNFSNQVPKSVLLERMKNFEGCGVADNNVYI